MARRKIALCPGPAEHSSVACSVVVVLRYVVVVAVVVEK